MTTIQKPAAPLINPQTIGKHLDELKSAVEGAKDASGALDARALADQLKQADPALADGFKAVVDAFAKVERRTVSSSCGGSTTREERIPPARLDAAQVKSVMGALIDAKLKAKAADSDGDGKLSRNEGEFMRGTSDLATNVAHSMVEGEYRDYDHELANWKSAIGNVASSIDARQQFDVKLQNAAHAHAATPAGAEAIVWAYRDLATSGHADIWDIQAALKNAETSMLSRIPLFGRAAIGTGHLSDDEVKSLLRTDNLAQFAAAKRAAVEGRVGDYQNSYLKGTDLPGHEQINDPDAKRSTVSSTCG